MDDINLKFRNCGDGTYDVFFGDVLLGSVYRDDEAWSDARWFITGGRKERTPYCAGSQVIKPHGFRSRAGAGCHLARMQSSLIMQSCK